MDEVVFQLEATGISENAVQSNFDDLYRFRERCGGQEQRRKDLLEIQKSNRSKNMDISRGIILDLVNSVSDQVFRTPRKHKYKPTILVSGFNKSVYREVLMLSEWMTERPSDLEKNWYVVPCPKGARTMVIATNGVTKVFSKNGHFMFQCSTALPGGNGSSNMSSSYCCVLDCIYDKSSCTMYVLDILAWNNQPMTDGECDFRYFWLKTYVAELEGISVLNKKNKLIFSILPKHPCDRKSLNNVMQTYPHFTSDVALDGMLFYHMNSHYVSGVSPVSVWLFPFMVPEILGQDITVSTVYMCEKPHNYTTQADYIEEFERKMAKKKSRAQQSLRASSLACGMDVAYSEDSGDPTGISEENDTFLNAETMESEIVNGDNQVTENMESVFVSESNGNVGEGM